MNMSNGNINTKLPAVNRGFSLVELMVALVITLILLAGIGQIFLSSKKSFTIQNALGRQQENGRYVMDTLAQDLRRAGYLGGALKIEQTGWSKPVATGADTCANSTDWGRMLDRPIYGLDDDATGYACVKSYLQGDVLVVRYAAPWELGGVTTPRPAAGKWPDRLYIRSNPTNPKTARIFQGEPPALDTNDRDAELIAYTYYVGTSSQTCSYGGADVPIPSLFRVRLDDSGQPDTPEEIASGIEQLQVQYGVDTDAIPDLVVDQYFDAKAISTDTGTTPNWNQVVSARIWVLTRAECPETGYTNTNTYDMGNISYPAKPDRYRRQLYQTTVKLRNRIGAS
jgi:type IV pilus assembly protein PilW